MTTVEIGRGKTGSLAYPLDDIGIVPSRRTRDPEEVSVAWQIDAYRFEMPLVASPMDSVVSPSFAARLGGLGGLAVLDLEGLWTRFPDPEPILAEVAELGHEAATRRLQQIYAEPTKALAGSVKSRRYQPTYPCMLAVEKSPALYEFGTVTGDQPSVAATFRHHPAAIPRLLGSARYSHVPPSR